MNSKNSEARSAKYKATREALRQLSNQVKIMIDSGELDVANINEGLIRLYSQDGHSEFKTFHQWKKDGKSIKKGSKAFTVWASPQEIPHPDPESDDEEMTYFPICYLFSNKQVTERRAS